MGIKDLSHQEKALILAGIFCILLIGGIVFLGIQFNKINQVGVQCMSSPLIYAENRMFEDKGERYDCSCSILDIDKLSYVVVSYP